MPSTSNFSSQAHDEGIAAVARKSRAPLVNQGVFSPTTRPHAQPARRPIPSIKEEVRRRKEESSKRAPAVRFFPVVAIHPSTANGRHVFARPVDFGPGDGTVIDGQATRDTGRIADLSPGVARALGLLTNDGVMCELIA